MACRRTPRRSCPKPFPDRRDVLDPDPVELHVLPVTSARSRPCVSLAHAIARSCPDVAGRRRSGPQHEELVLEPSGSALPVRSPGRPASAACTGPTIASGCGGPACRSRGTRRARDPFDPLADLERLVLLRPAPRRSAARGSPAPTVPDRVDEELCIRRSPSGCLQGHERPPRGGRGGGIELALRPGEGCEVGLDRKIATATAVGASSPLLALPCACDHLSRTSVSSSELQVQTVSRPGGERQARTARVRPRSAPQREAPERRPNVGPGKHALVQEHLLQGGLERTRAACGVR